MPKGRPSKVKWTPELDGAIRELYAEMGPARLAERLSVPIGSLETRAKRLGVRFREENSEWTPTMEAILKERYATDGPAKLALELGLTPTAITAKARRMKVGATRKTPPKGFKWTDEMLTAIRERYTDESAHQLAEEFGVRLGAVRRKAYEFGLRTNAGHERWGRERAENNDSLDIHYFDQWSSNMAYVLGFLFADACMDDSMRQVAINLKEGDESVLRFIQAELKAIHPIRREDGRFDKRTGNTNQPKVSLHLCSAVMCEQLIRLGLRPRKTYNDDPFPDVPDEMMPHFVRGYLDGDGSTSINCDSTLAVGFVGSPLFIIGIHNSLVRLADMLVKKIKMHHGPTADWTTVVWSAARDIRLFREFAYPDGYAFCLERKKANLDRWLSGTHRENEPRRPWTGEEMTVLRNQLHLIGPAAVGRLIGRKKGSVSCKARELGLR